MFKMPLSIFTKDETFPFFIQYGEHKEDLYLHSHDNFSELVIVLNGTAEHIVDDERYRIMKGDVFVISDETEHGYTDVHDFRICNIMFDPRYFMTPELDITGSAGFQALFVLEPQCTKNKSFTSRLRLDIDSFIRINSMIEKMHKEYSEKNIGWKTMIKSDFLELTVMLSRLYSIDNLADEKGIITLASAIAYIEKNYTEQLTVAGLAKLSNYSERQFLRLFHKAFGCMPMTYVANLRMQKARELLRTTDLTVTETAFRCGYSDSNYFSRVFKKFNDATPSEFRAHSHCT